MQLPTASTLAKNFMKGKDLCEVLCDNLFYNCVHKSYVWLKLHVSPQITLFANKSQVNDVVNIFLHSAHNYYL